MPSEYDVAIVGAGAAGLGAAVTLLQAPLRTIVLEARARAGGRARTILPVAGLPIDEGCGWLHSADENALVPAVEAAGFTIDRTPPAWQKQSNDIAFPAGEQEAFRQAFDAFEARLEDAASQGSDRPAADFFTGGGRWNALMDAVSSYYNGSEYDQVSVLDYAAYRDSGVNWRVREGYGAAILALASSVAVMGDCAVARIDHEGPGVRLPTPRGEIRARRAIVAVPTPHLAAGRIVLPGGQEEKIEAAAALPLGLANKVFLELGAPAAVPVDGHLFGRTDRTETGSYHLRPFGRPYVEAFLGGRHAETLEEAGPGAASAFAIEELRQLLGADFAKGLRPIAETAWGRDPHALGSYSHARPGQADARKTLATTSDGRLFWAGEATHPTAFSTAHGAWETGVRAAQEVLRSLGESRPMQ